jgi:alpha-amylase
MVDVVANHMAYSGTAETVNYSTLNPFDSKNYFHNICWINDYDNQTEVEQVCHPRSALYIESIVD